MTLCTTQAVGVGANEGNAVFSSPTQRTSDLYHEHSTYNTQKPLPERFDNPGKQEQRTLPCGVAQCVRSGVWCLSGGSWACSASAKCRRAQTCCTPRPPRSASTASLDSLLAVWYLCRTHTWVQHQQAHDHQPYVLHIITTIWVSPAAKCSPPIYNGSECTCAAIRSCKLEVGKEILRRLPTAAHHAVARYRRRRRLKMRHGMLQSSAVLRN